MYQRPEILEIGQAAELTLGFVNRKVCDGCDCTKDAAAEEVALAEV